MSFEDYNPPVIRHNSCFLHKCGMGEVGPSAMRPLLVGCNYHDMVRETIYLAGSRDVVRIGKHLASKDDREAAKLEWSQNRFRKQRETAALWRDMRETFDTISGKPQGERPATSEAKPPPQPAAPACSTPSRSSMRGGGLAGGRRGSGSYFENSLAGELFEELSAMGLTRPGSTASFGSSGGLGRSASQPSFGAAKRQPVVRQTPGTRGLPKGFRPAVAMHTGVMMFPKDRAFHYKDTS